MRKSFYIFLCLFSFCLYANAQSRSIVDDLNTPKAGQGKIVIYQDEGLKNLVGANMISSIASNTNTVSNQLATSTDGEATTDAPKNFIRAKGYRIQVYSGSDQKVARNEANSRKGAIQSSFPNMEVTVSYNSPVWRVRAGNFKTQEQASQALSEMKAKFPGFGREMRIVDDVIKIPVD
ncbi:SPOR domain-containing protein [Dysgonomonas alginatilytica]|nr:SPOR domain-containing protein [Dysgonomonas alginatilytica]